MAVQAPTNGKEIRLADVDAIDLSGNFTVGGWCRQDGVSATWAYCCGIGDYNDANSFNVGRNSENDALQITTKDSSGNYMSGGSPLINIVSDWYAAANYGVWRHILMRNDGTDFTVWADGVKTYDATLHGSWDGITAGTTFGINTRGSAGGNEAIATYAEWAKWDTDLSDAAIVAMSKGATPSMFPQSLTWYAPLRAVTEPSTYIGEIALTNTNMDTVADHPPVFYSDWPQNVFTAGNVITLSSPTLNYGDLTAILACVTSDTAGGTLYLVAQNEAVTTIPTAAQIKLGQDGDGTTSPDVQSTTIS